MKRRAAARPRRRRSSLPRPEVTHPRSSARRWGWRLAAVALLVLAGAILTRGRGFDARQAPAAVEARLALAARAWLVPADARARPNPVPKSADVLEAGLRHWADHCASCHGNDGSGDTPIGRSLYPQAPDMRLARTQALTDGELFYLIEQGIPLTGMPAWRTGTEEGERASWELVRFIRHLSSLTPEDLERMSALNPKTAGQIENERRLQEFLKGGQ